MPVSCMLHSWTSATCVIPVSRWSLFYSLSSVCCVRMFSLVWHLLVFNPFNSNIYLFNFSVILVLLIIRQNSSSSGVSRNIVYGFHYFSFPNFLGWLWYDIFWQLLPTSRPLCLGTSCKKNLGLHKRSAFHRRKRYIL